METIFDDRLGASDDVWPAQIREALHKSHDARCARYGWMQDGRGSQGWNLDKEPDAADAAPGTTQPFFVSFEGPGDFRR